MQVNRNQSVQSAQALVDAFLSIKRSKGLTEGTIGHYRNAINAFEDWRSIPHDELNQLDMVGYVNKLRESKLNPTTIEMRLQPVKQFLRWTLSGGIQGGRLKGPHAACVTDLEIKKRVRTKPPVYITPVILEEFLGECHTLQQKVYFTMVYDTGARLSEVLNLKIKEVYRDENGLCIEVDGKTGYRKNWLHESIPLVMSYINSMTSQPDNWLFNSMVNGTSNGPKSNARLTTAAVDSWCYRIVKRLKKRGILQDSDKLTVHTFRHTKARNLKRLKWSNDEINVWMGWTKTSNMATYYGQAREEDIVHRFREDTGRESHDEIEEHRTCPVCQAVNGAISKFCNDCGNALRPEFAARRDQQHSIQVQAELHQARQLIKQIQSSKFLSEQLGLETA